MNKIKVQIMYDLIKSIHNAGGIAVLAHPACCWAINPKKFVKELVDIGLDGIEIYYPYDRFRGILKFSSKKLAVKIAEIRIETSERIITTDSNVCANDENADVTCSR